MALFNVSVLVTLRLDRTEREAIQRMATAADALVAKLNEPDPEPPPDEAGLQAQVDALTLRLKESNDRLEAKDAEGRTGSA